MIDSFLFQHRTRGRHDPTNSNRHTDVFAQTHQSTVRQDRRHERCLRLFAGNLADGVYCRRNIHEIRGSGYVVESLEAALWCFLHTDNFRDAILCATNLGDDADTTAAICGQIAGAYYGEDEIPATWLDTLAMRHEIGDLSDQLYALATCPSDA